MENILKRIKKSQNDYDFFYCPNCSKYLQRPFQLKCIHSICSDCYYDESLSNCPKCDVIISRDDAIEDLGFNTILKILAPIFSIKAEKRDCLLKSPLATSTPLNMKYNKVDNEELIVPIPIRTYGSNSSTKNKQPDTFDRIISKSFELDTSKKAGSNKNGVDDQIKEAEKYESNLIASENEDLYSKVSKLVKFICNQQGIEGSMIIEGIGKIEVKLSTPQQIIKPESRSVATSMNIEYSDVAICATIKTMDKMINTEGHSYGELSVQTDLDQFVSVGVEKREDEYDKLIAGLSQVSDGPISSNNSNTVIVKNTQTEQEKSVANSMQRVDEENSDLEMAIPEITDSLDDLVSKIEYDTPSDVEDKSDASNSPAMKKHKGDGEKKYNKIKFPLNDSSSGAETVEGQSDIKSRLTIDDDDEEFIPPTPEDL